MAKFDPTQDSLEGFRWCFYRIRGRCKDYAAMLGFRSDMTGYAGNG